MHLRKPAALNQFGDTIVEVMIVLAVLGLAISISYATANRSLLNTRQALENSQATELVQAQVEALQSMTCSAGSDNCTPDTTVFDTANVYCIDTGANPYTTVPIPHPDDLTSYPPPCAPGTVPYDISIRYTNTATTPDTFTVTALWPDVLGEGNDSVTLVYRLHHQ